MAGAASGAKFRDTLDGTPSELVFEDARMKPLHLALFMNTLDAGGAEKNMALLAQGFAGQGMQVDFLLQRASGSYLNLLPQSVHVIDLKSRRNIASLLPLVKYLRSEHPQVLFSTLNHASLLALISRRLAGVSTRVIIRIVSPISLSMRSRSPKSYLERRMMRWIFPRAEGLIAVSDGVAEDLATFLGIPRAQIHTIYNPAILPEIGQLAAQETPHPWFQAGHPPVILSVGRLNAVKDYPTLIRAFQRVQQAREARLVILGKGDQREMLLAQVKEAGMEGIVDFPGYVTNPYAYMKRANVFVLSSLREGLSNVLIEAMACGCPVVATDCPGGVTEELNGGLYGHLTAVSDEVALSRAILSVLDGEIRRPPPEWLEQFTFDFAFNQYFDLVRRICE